MPSQALPILSLFCGAGGLDYGFRQAKFKTVFACDNFEPAVQTYNFNAKRKIAQIADLSVIDPKDLLKRIQDCASEERPVGLIGGPPCQGFSRGNASADPNDSRNLLPFRFADVLAALNAKYRLKFFVFENVMGLQNPKHYVRFRAIQQSFHDAGFKLFQQDLDAQDFGVPQIRRRLFVVGLNARIFPRTEFVFPKGGTKRCTVRDAIHGLPKAAFFERGTTARDIGFHPNHWTMRPKSPKLSQIDPQSDGRSFRRLEWDSVSPTVAYGNREIHVHPDGGRRLTVLEAMLLQGFPRTYRMIGNLSQQVTQVSNAVPPPVAAAIARSIRALLLAGEKNGRRR
jgi:DNA (cytosine-5)-methyltransferase 1